MDARLEYVVLTVAWELSRVLTIPSPAAHLGIKEGEPHVIRNAGGVAFVSTYHLQWYDSDRLQSKEALRSLIISQQLLGTREIAVFHHTGCGMLTFTNESLKDSLKQKYPSSSQEIDSINFLSFGNLEQSVKDDVDFLTKHPLVLDETTITGWVYEVETGKVRKLMGTGLA